MLLTSKNAHLGLQSLASKDGVDIKTESNSAETPTSPKGLEAFFKGTKPVPSQASARSSSAAKPGSSVVMVPKSNVFDLPVGPKLAALSRSERLFSIATKIDIRSLSISEKDEFHLFMEMRKERQWTSWNMTSNRWVKETIEYNQRLTDVNKKADKPTIEKNPRALFEKLASIEAKILDRIATSNYLCKFPT